MVKASNGHGAYWTKAIAEADDHDESNGKTILNFFEAQDVAKKLARGGDGSADSAPITVETGRACTSAACCCQSRWRCLRPPS